MQKVFLKSSCIEARILQFDEDWELYRDFCQKAYGTDLNRFLMGADPLISDSWAIHFQKMEDMGYKTFVLVEGQKVIGSTAILFRDGDAFFTGSIIDSDFRGKGLADQLYDVRKRYLKDMDFQGQVKTQVLSSNSSSIKAAVRNGFSSTGEIDGYGHITFELSIA